MHVAVLHCETLEKTYSGISDALIIGVIYEGASHIFGGMRCTLARGIMTDKRRKGTGKITDRN